ncbi:DUF6479 family protein [Kitasatospora sp. NPDC059646]|uniref:DUF6479 family protein n=1 Tax=Kitasatospora sp. NPDC059646 TaxID=3346893 RepID=UPI0036C8FF41
MTADLILAAESTGPSLLVVLVPALIIAALLIGAFAWGSHRRAHRRPPVTPGRPNGPRADSWTTPDDEQR